MKRKLTKFSALLLGITMILSACAPKEAPAPAPASAPAATAETPAATQEPAPATAEAPAGEKIVTMAMTNAWDTMMPLNTNSNYSVVIFDQIYDRLTMSTGEGKYVPRLAESWEPNADSTAVTFHLNKNATWQDGTPLTAADVVLSFQMYSNKDVEALSRYYLQYITGTDGSGVAEKPEEIGVKATDDQTVVISLKSPMYYETLLNDLNNVYVVPKHILEGKTPAEINSPDTWAKPIGSGPFKYASEINGERMEFVKNENYFLGAPDIDRLIIRIVPSTNLLAGLMSGEIDIIAGGALGSIMLDDWDMAKEQANLNTASIPTTNYQTLIMNTQKPYLTEKVRQALSMAVNREAIVSSLLKGEGQVIISPIAPISPYYDPNVTVWYDPEKAKQILTEENFPFDQELVFLVPSGNVTRERAAALIQQDFQKLGLKVNIQSVDFPTLMNSMREEKHDFGIIGSGGSMDPSESRQMIHPDSDVNFGRLTSTELADILDQGTAALTFEERKPFFNKYQERIKEVIPMAYLFTTNALMAYNKRLSGVKPEDFGYLNWRTWEWKVQ